MPASRDVEARSLEGVWVWGAFFFYVFYVFIILIFGCGWRFRRGPRRPKHSGEVLHSRERRAFPGKKAVSQETSGKGKGLGKGLGKGAVSQERARERAGERRVPGKGWERAGERRRFPQLILRMAGNITGKGEAFPGKGRSSFPGEAEAGNGLSRERPRCPGNAKPPRYEVSARGLHLNSHSCMRSTDTAAVLGPE